MIFLIVSNLIEDTLVHEIFKAEFNIFLVRRTFLFLNEKLFNFHVGSVSSISVDEVEDDLGTLCFEMCHKILPLIVNIYLR